MAGSGPLLTPDQIRAVLVEVGERLASQGLRGTVVIAGGSFLALNGWRAEGTRDVDAVTRLDEAVKAAAADLAGVHGFTLDWLNDRALRFVPTTFEVESVAPFSSSTRVCTCSVLRPTSCSSYPYLVDFVGETALAAGR